MNKILEQDLENVIASEEDLLRCFTGKKILVTGATGLIGSLIVRTLVLTNKKYGTEIQISLGVRNLEKARGMFSDDEVTFLELNNLDDQQFDYIVHTVSPTRSEFLANNPVEVLDVVVGGTREILELSRKQRGLGKVVYLSSMEAYGVLDESGVTEDRQGYVSLNNTRNSYAVGKRTAEFYGFSYFKEYGVPVVNARLAMCFGAGASDDDNRVCAALTKKALKEGEIKLETTGETVLNFVYTTDAVRAVLRLLVDGGNGETYNICSDDFGKTIFDMAREIAGRTNATLEVLGNNEMEKYAPINKMILSNEKIKSLGWKSEFDLGASIERLVEYYR